MVEDESRNGIRFLPTLLGRQRDTGEASVDGLEDVLDTLFALLDELFEGGGTRGRAVRDGLDVEDGMSGGRHDRRGWRMEGGPLS